MEIGCKLRASEENDYTCLGFEDLGAGAFAVKAEDLDFLWCSAHIGGGLLCKISVRCWESVLNSVSGNLL